MIESITIEDLVEELQKMANLHPGISVITSSNYGDHCRTEQASPIALGDCAEVVRLATTAYSESGYSVVREDDDLERWQECEEDEQYLLLKGR